MVYIKFLNDENAYEVDIELEGNIATLKFNADSEKKVSTAGFNLFNDAECEQDIGGDF